MNDALVAVIDKLIDEFGEDEFARILYERVKDRRDEFSDSAAAKGFFAMMDARANHSTEARPETGNA
jgi:hypothetical protein